MNNTTTQCRCIRYDMLDGCVNDAFTIHASELTRNELITLEGTDDGEILSLINKWIGLGAHVGIDHSCDFGAARIELIDTDTGEAVGAIDWSPQ